MKNLECLIYISRCTLDRPVLETELDDIVAVSAFRNRNANIAGVLVYQDGYFIQLLEGAPAALDLLMIHLHFDSRHEDIRVVSRDRISARNAISWAMVTPPAAHPLRRQLQSLIANPPTGIMAWRNILMEMVPEDA